jgi:oligopeptide transport system substrate-binding protein
MRDLCITIINFCRGRPLCLPRAATGSRPYARNSFYSISIIFALMFCLFGCERKTLVEIGTAEQVMHIGNGTDVQGVDPATTTGMPEYHIIMALFEGLVSKDPQTLDTIPGVADRWTISDDGMKYEFHIRDNAKWSNGQPMTAQDFVDSWHRSLMPALGNEYIDSLFVFKNAEKFYKGEITDINQVGFKAVDSQNLLIELEEPAPYFLQLLDHHSLFPVPVSVIKQFGAVDDPANPWTKVNNFVGNGAFVIEEWVPGKVFRVKKNLNYWAAKSVKLNAINFYPIEQLLTEERMFRAGYLHKTEWMPYAKIEKYKKSNDPNYRTHPYIATYFYLINVTKAPLNDVRVRKALTYAVDRKAITENVTRGNQVPTGALTPPNTLGYSPRSKMEFNPDLAKKLLAEAGYADGRGFPEIELIYNTQEDHQKVAQAVQAMWKKYLGIKVNIKNQEWKVYLNTQKQLEFGLSRMAWVGDYVDPNTFLELFITDGGNNRTGWSNKQYDALIDKAAKAHTREERYEYFMQAEDILIDQVPFIPIYHYSTNNLVSTDVKGYYDNLMDYHPYKYIYLESDKEKNE